MSNIKLNILREKEIFLSKIIISFKDRMYLFLENERKRGREPSMWERNIDRLPLACALTEDWSCNLGMCPDQELNQQPFALQDIAQPTELHQSRLQDYLKSNFLHTLCGPKLMDNFKKYF